MNINWFPGHMSKTRREIKENLKYVDAVIEIRDARIVKSSSNPEIDEICKDKPRIIILNKCDLSEDKVTEQWIKKLSTDNIKVIKGNSLTGEGLNNIKNMLNNLLKNKINKMKEKGLTNFTIRTMVVGIPNVGKSSFINKMAKSSRAKTGNKPGVTKSKQWIKTKIGIELMDTPGVLWPKFEDEQVGLNLAFTGAIKDEIMDLENLALRLLQVLKEHYGENLKNRYKIDFINEDCLKLMEDIAIKRGAVISGGNIDYNRVSHIILEEFRSGKIGKISLERP